MADYDIAFIGAGPAGYVGAIRARQLGLRTLVVEREKVGGVCLNVGCIPSKALIEKATAFRTLAEMEAFGVSVDRVGFDYSKVQAASRAAADRLSKGVDFLLKKNGVDFIAGEARPVAPRGVAVKEASGAERVATAEAVVVATGSRPRLIPGFEFDEKLVLSSTGALAMKDLPASMAILGAGAIGMEFAYIMNAFGVKVTVVELLDRILPMEDAEAAAAVRSAFEKRGVRFMTGTRATGLRRSAAAVAPLLLETAPASGAEPPSSFEVDRLLVAVGRAPNTEGLGLEGLGIALEKGYVKTGAYYETTAAGFYAVGDVSFGDPQLAHAASAQAEIVAERVACLLGKGPAPHAARLDNALVPSAVYCEPQVAGFGLRSAEGAGREVKLSSFPFRGIGKAVAVGRPEGFVKVATDAATGEVLGASAVGAEATELVHEFLVAASIESTAGDLARTVFAHPTLSEAVKEAALASEGRAIHA